MASYVGDIERDTTFDPVTGACAAAVSTCHPVEGLRPLLYFVKGKTDKH